MVLGEASHHLLASSLKSVTNVHGDFRKLGGPLCRSPYCGLLYSRGLFRAPKLPEPKRPKATRRLTRLPGPPEYPSSWLHLINPRNNGYLCLAGLGSVLPKMTWTIPENVGQNSPFPAGPPEPGGR